MKSSSLRGAWRLPKSKLLSLETREDDALLPTNVCIHFNANYVDIPDGREGTLSIAIISPKKHGNIILKEPRLIIFISITLHCMTNGGQELGKSLTGLTAIPRTRRWRNGNGLGCS